MKPVNRCLELKIGQKLQYLRSLDAAQSDAKDGSRRMLVPSSASLRRRLGGALGSVWACALGS